MGVKMRDIANDLLLKLLKTPAVAEQVRKSLVNRDIAITIDGKEYQILKKRPDTDEELVSLKARNYDLTQSLKDIVESVTGTNGFINADNRNFWDAIKNARKVLGLFD